MPVPRTQSSAPRRESHAGEGVPPAFCGLPQPAKVKELELCREGCRLWAQAPPSRCGLWAQAPPSEVVCPCL